MASLIAPTNSSSILLSVRFDKNSASKIKTLVMNFCVSNLVAKLVRNVDMAGAPVFKRAIHLE